MVQSGTQHFLSQLPARHDIYVYIYIYIGIDISRCIDIGIGIDIDVGIDIIQSTRHPGKQSKLD